MFVAAETHRRGGYAVTFAGNMPEIDILATDASNTRRVSIQVKTKTSGTFMRCGQTSSRAMAASVRSHPGPRTTPSKPDASPSGTIAGTFFAFP